MVKYYILIKRKSAKGWTKAIPVKKGVSLPKVRTFIRNRLRTGISSRIVSQSAFVKYLKGFAKTKKVKKRRVTKKRKTTRKRRVVKKRATKRRKK